MRFTGLLLIPLSLSAASFEDVTARTPLHFEPNLGQFEPGVRFAARGSDVPVFLTSTEMVITRPGAGPLRMKLRGARVAKLEPVDLLPGVSNYYWGSDPKKCRERVPHYARVWARGVYEGVDVIYYANGKRFEYDFVLAPGADPSRIELAFEGAERIALSPTGDLVLAAKSGEVRQRKPLVYQEVAGRRVEVAGRYRIREDRVGFELAAYDASRPLVIDPILEYGTYFGGSVSTYAAGVATDASGAIIVAGTTSGGIPLMNLPLTALTIGSFVARIQPDGKALTFSTYFAGSIEDLALDPAGNIYVTGRVDGSLPVLNAIQPQYKGAVDGFLARLTPGGTLTFATYLGGDGSDELNGVAADAQSVIVVGTTSSTDFPGGIPGSPAMRRGVAIKLASDGSARLWSSVLAGGDMWDVALDSSGAAYIAGVTGLPLATPGAFQAVTGGQDAFIAKLTTLGQRAYIAQFGPLSPVSGPRPALSLAVDASGRAYVAGTTSFFGFPTVNAYLDTYRGSATAFLTALNAQGSGLVFSTLFGGFNYSRGDSVTVTPSGDILFAGRTYPDGFPVLNAWMPHQEPGTLGFLAKFTNSGQLRYSTLYGSSESGATRAVVAATPGGAAVMAITARLPKDNDPDLVTPGAYDVTRNGHEDIVIGRFVDGPDPLPVTITSVPAGRRIRVDGQIVLTPVQFWWQPGSPHLIDATAQAYQETVLPFLSWSHGGEVLQRVVIPPGGTTYQANFGTTPCTFSISPASAHFGVLGSTIPLTGTTQIGCPWSASSDLAATNDGPTLRTGSGTLNARIPANPGGPRTGWLRVGNATFTITQAGGSVSLPPPSVTTDFSNAFNSSKRVTLSWPAVAGASGYEIHATQLPLSAPAGMAQRLVYSARVASSSNVNSATVDMVDGAYLFHVRACQGSGFGDANCGGLSTLFATSRLRAPVSAPVVLHPTEGQVLTSSTQQFRWQAVGGAASYGVRLTVPESNGAGRRTILDIRTTDSSTIFTMPSSLDYELTVSACDAGCFTDPSLVRRFSVQLPAVSAAPPSGLTAQVVNGNTINASWNPVPGADLYRVQAVQPNTGPGGGALTVAARQISTASISLPVPAGAASLIVNACNGDGCGPPATVAVNPSGPNSAVPVIAAPMPVLVANGPVVTISWSRIAGDDGSNTDYRLYVGDLSRDGPALDVITRNNFHGAYLLAEGRRYDALVFATRNGNTVTGPASGFMVAGTSAAAPLITAPTHGSTFRQGPFRLAWSPMPEGPGLLRYQYYVARQGQSAPVLTGMTTGLFVDTSLAVTAPTQFNAIVRACYLDQCTPDSDAGWGPWSNTVTGTTAFTILP